MPEPLADGDGIERKVEEDGEGGVNHRGESGRDAQRVRYEHRRGDQHGPGQGDGDGDPTELDEETLVVGVRPEDRDITLLEKQAKGHGAQEFQKSSAATAPIGKP